MNEQSKSGNDQELQIVDRYQKYFRIPAEMSLTDMSVKQSVHRQLAFENSRSTQLIFQKYHEAELSGQKIVMAQEDVEQILKNHCGAAIKQAQYYYRIFHYNRNGSFYSTSLSFEDFFQEALTGILEAIGKYDYTHPSKATFNTYAHYWIRKSCQDYLRNNASIIRMPIWRQGKEDYQFSFVEMDDPDKRFREFVEEVNETSPYTFQNDMDKDYFFNFIKQTLHLSRLHDKFGFEIICHRYGVNGHEQLTPGQIGDLLNMKKIEVQDV